MTKSESKLDPWAIYLGPNLGYVQEQYEKYLNIPDSVNAEFRILFEQAGKPPYESEPICEIVPTDRRTQPQLDMAMLQHVVAANKLIGYIRTYGHLAANTDPLGLRNKSDNKSLETDTYELNEVILSAIPASLIWNHAPKHITSGWEAVQTLLDIYTSAFSCEFSHVHNEEERDWLNQHVESNQSIVPLSRMEQLELLKRLLQVEQFEHFLHRTFVGQKRFSIEGVDMLVPMLDEIVNRLIHDGAKDVLMGMAHRGRLNVLTHVFGKPYSAIFSEFHHSPDKELVPSEGSTGINYGWTGDVKYHLGAYRVVQEGETVQAKLTLANNPSHLEFVDPIVEGFTRAAQEDTTKPGFPTQNVAKAVAVLIHGDAAFPGEGVVAETLNFNNLSGFSSGGTIHIITNNRLGFTADSSDTRSTHYASDLAKGYEIPIVHINADDPEACIAAVRLATEYRLRFHKDFLIDLVGYRRYGHNESDDPDTTQPLMYSKVHSHPTVSDIYADRLRSEGTLQDEQVVNMKREALQVMQADYEHVKQHNGTDQESDNPQSKKATEHKDTVVETAVSIEQLREINNHLLDVPQGFQIYPKLKRILERRADALDEGGKVDWALAETLAFATILSDGIPIRLSGQDSERGTFAQRNLVLHDPVTGDTFCPLHALPKSAASFAIYNSPLSEISVLGFEYGYNVFSPGTLVIWEAQYGDFANCAQVIIDQFVAAGKAKWEQSSSLVLLLPHGYEGQGPEHSSARLERFLQSSAEGNWTVANLTSAAQYYHLLRNQAALTRSKHARPLILMAPKSLLRNQQVASPGVELTEGSFLPVMDQQGLGGQANLVERLVLCSGKIAIDLEAALADLESYSWLHVVRVEQLYPFPELELKRVIGRYPQLKQLVWLQEEPQNMGAWTYIEPRIRKIISEGLMLHYMGRPERSSPASGYQTIHKYEQAQMIEKALKPIHSYKSNER